MLKLYIKLTNDAAAGLELQDKIIRNLLPQKVIELHSGHLPMLCKPAELANLINENVSKKDSLQPLKLTKRNK